MSYALNNPLRFVDPTGLYCVDSDGNDLVDTNGAQIFDDEGACRLNSEDNQWITVDGQDNLQQKMTVTGDNGSVDFNTVSNYNFSNTYVSQTPQSQGQQQSLFGRLVSSAVCTIAKPLTSAARTLNSTIGVGAGASGGVGFIAGVAGSLGVQAVADSQGNVGLAINAGYNPGYLVFGVGAVGGGQISYSTAPNIYALGGSSLGAGFSTGPGGVDVAFSGSGTTVTGTFGFGAGTKGAAASWNHTWVPLSTKCGQ